MERGMEGTRGRERDNYILEQNICKDSKLRCNCVWINTHRAGSEL